MLQLIRHDLRPWNIRIVEQSITSSFVVRGPSYISVVANHR